jgi:vacuolar iron transporter family protein
MSMAVGEYVSVSTQRQVERAELDIEQTELVADPDNELDELAKLLQGRGIQPALARQVAMQLTERDALAAHARVELGIDPSVLTSPWAAALASVCAFTIGGLIPLVAMLLAPRSIEMWVSGGAVLFALALSGAISAWLGGTPSMSSMVRTVAGGVLAMGITYAVGYVAGTQL